MSLNFSQLAGTSVVDTATEPRRIFAALPAKDPRYGYPRDVQTEIWEGWHPRRTERDLVIKMNTGGGKTVVGLTILKSCLNEGVGPAAYISPDIYLKNQVIAEAGRLKLAVTDDPRDGRFLSGKAILATHVQRLVNGRSVFHLANDPRPSVKLGVVLVDDAHNCVTTIADQFTLKVPAEHPAYPKLLDLFEAELRVQSAATLKDLRTKNRAAAMRIPFWSWIDQRSEVLDVLHPYRDDDEFQWTWPLIKDSLPLCRAVISADAFEVAPPCPAIDQIPSFTEAQRRIYMTATLADDSILVTHCGADAESIATPITPRSADDLGDRMILTPLDTHPQATEEEVRDLLVEQSTRHNVVVIVPSKYRAQWWRPFAMAVHDKDSIEEGVEALRKGHVGLVVLINKYDGIDLADDACRILAIDGLPEAYSGLDRLESLALENTQAMVTRQIQRIEQGMGRAIRSNEDYCVVLLLGPRLTQRLHQMGTLEQFSPGTRAQMSLSGQVAELLRDKPFADLPSVIAQCLDRDPGWVGAIRNVLDSVACETTSVVSESAIGQRQAFRLAEIGQFTAAMNALQKVIDITIDPKQRGWLKEIAAGYLHHDDKVKAQSLQMSAKGDNKFLLTPRAGIQYNRIARWADQAQAAADYLGATYKSGAELVIGLAAIVADLRMVPDDYWASQRFEQALHELGRHLGFMSQRPDHEVGTGPDVLWATGSNDYLPIECKSGVSTAFIAKKDAAQRSQTMDWFKANYPTSNATAVIVHPTATLHAQATAPQGTRVITKDKLAALRLAVTALGTALSADTGFRNPATIASQLQALHLGGGGFLNYFGAVPRHR
jgi:replicative superfamily II helicase